MLREDELFYLIAFSLIKGIGPVVAKKIIQDFGSVQQVFEAPEEISNIPANQWNIVKEIRNKSTFKRAEEEIKFIQENNISFVLYHEQSFPYRLNACNDAPLFLFYKGNITFNPKYTLAVVGTRRATNYGKLVVDKIIEGIRNYPVQIISGLAFGIDIAAHKAAIRNNMETIGIVAHGLDKIYPSQHRHDVSKMIDKGGIVSEFLSGTIPERENFPRRNRIIAGMSDATLVVESSAKGGSLITAELAWGYNREVMAVPGNVYSKTSEGCHQLIKKNKAALITSSQDIIQYMGWEKHRQKNATRQLPLFNSLSEQEQKIVSMLQQEGILSIDIIGQRAGLPAAQTATLLLTMELSGVIQALPGKLYRLK